MNDRRVVELTLDVIDVGDRLRAVDPLLVEALARSIEARGLLSPIEVEEAANHDRYVLVAGAHRLEAVRSLKWDRIPAFLRAPRDEFEARLVEIEENLVRHELTALDKAAFLKEWKAIYLRMTNARGRGRPKNSDKLSEFPLAFPDAVSKRLGVTPRDLHRSIKRMELHAELRAALAGHPAADHGAMLDALLKLSPEHQDEIAVALAQNRAMKLPDLRRLIGGDAPKGPRDPFEAFILLWAKCPPATKGQIKRFIAKEKWTGKGARA